MLICLSSGSARPHPTGAVIGGGEGLTPLPHLSTKTRAEGPAGSPAPPLLSAPAGVILQPCPPAGQLGKEVTSIHSGIQALAQGSAHL